MRRARGSLAGDQTPLARGVVTQQGARHHGTRDSFIDQIDGPLLGDIFKPSAWEKTRTEGPRGAGCALEGLTAADLPARTRDLRRNSRTSCGRGSAGGAGRRRLRQQLVRLVVSVSW